MKKIRLMATLLCLMMVMTMLPVTQASATTLTEADILSPYEVSPATTIDFRNKTMDQVTSEIAFTKNDSALTGATATNFYSAGSDGFTFDCAGDTENFYGFYPTVALSNDFTDGKSYKIKFRLDEADSDINIRIKKNSGADIRFWTVGRELYYLHINENGVNETKATGHVLNAGTFYTYILKLDDDVMTYYESTDDINYTQVVSYTPQVADANQIRFSSLLEGSVTFQSIIQYKKGAAPFQASEVLTSDLEKKKDIDFADYISAGDFFANSGFTPSKAQTVEAYTPATHDAVYSTSTDGLTVKSNNPWYGIDGINVAEYDIGNKAAFKFGFILKDANADFNMEFRSVGASTRLRFYTAGGVFAYVNSTGAGITVGDRLALNEEHVYVAVKDGTNIKLFKKNDDGTYAFLVSYAHPTATGNLFKMDCLPEGESELTLTHFEEYVVDSKVTFEEIMGNPVLRQSIDFNAGFDGTAIGASADGNASHSTAVATGLLDETGIKPMYSSAYQTIWVYKTQDYAPLENVGDAVEFRSKFQAGNTADKLQMQISMGNGERAYLSFYDNQIVYQTSSGSEKINDFDIDAYVGEWVTYLVRRVENGFELYAKFGADTKYKHIMTSDQALATGGNDQITMLNNSSDETPDAHIDYIKYWTTTNVALTDEQTTPANQTLLYQEDFAETPVGANIIANDGVVQNGNLILENGEYFNVGNAGIPTGGYAEWKFKTDKLGEFVFQDGKKLIGINLSLLHKTTIANTTYATGGLSHDANVYYIYRIVRNADTTYTLYQKKDGMNQWFKLMGDITITDNDGQPRLSLGSQGNTVVDYVKIYGPKSDAGVLLIDGKNATHVANATTALRYPGEICAIVNPSITEGTIIFVAYDGNNDLEKTEINKVSELQNGEVVFDASSAEIKSVKVFLWDNFKKMNPICGAQSLIK